MRPSGFVAIVLCLLASRVLAEAPTPANAIALAPAKVAAFSPDGKVLATGLTRDVLLWDVATGKQIGKLPGHTGEIYHLTFSPDGTLLASSSAWSDKTARVFDVASLKQIVSIDAPGDPKKDSRSIAALGFGADGKTLITGGSAVSVFNLPDGSVVKSTDVPADDTEAVMLPDGKTVLTLGRFTGKITAWDAVAGTPSAKQIKQTPESTPNMGGRMAVIGGGKKLALASFMSGGVYLFDLPTMSFEMKVKTPQHLQFADGSANGSELIYGSWETMADNFVVILDAKTAQERVKIGPFTKSQVFARALLSSDGKTLVAVPNEGSGPVLMWHVGK